jgi:hypothetical protein
MPLISIKELKVGMAIYVGRQAGFSAGGDDSYSLVTKIGTQYEIKTGEPYPVVFVGDKKFSGKTGEPLCEPWAYEIGGMENGELKVFVLEENDPEYKELKEWEAKEKERKWKYKGGAKKIENASGDGI